MRLIPPADYIDSQSNAELKFARLLTELPCDDAIAFHSVHLPRHRTQVMGEADFVVLWKGALLILEVKGGRLGRNQDGCWYSIDRADRNHPLKKSPWVQAKEATFSLLDILAGAKCGNGWPFTYAVVTPDQNLEPDAEWAPQQHIGLNRMTPAGLERSLDSLSRFARTTSGGAGGGRSHTSRPGQSLRAISTYLRREVDAMRTMSDTEQMIDREIVTMQDAQADIMQALEGNPRVLVLGGAGTGKTVLAVEAARRAAAAGSSVAFVCGSPGVLRMANALLDGSSVRLVPFDAIPAEPLFDVVIVDEAQDLLNLEDTSRLFDSLHGGLHHGCWWAFLDPNNQTHLTGKFDETVLQEMRSAAAIMNLTKNIRNSRSVVTAVQLHLGADLGSPGIGEGPKVSIVKTHSPEDILRLVDERVRSLRNQGVARKDIAIITATGDPTRSALATNGSLPRTYVVDGHPYEVITASDVKGLERQHVIVVDVAELDTPKGRAACYVSMSRPRYSLYVITSPDAYQVMERNVAEYFQQQSEKGGDRGE